MRGRAMSVERFVPRALKRRYGSIEKRWYASWPGAAERLPLPDFLGIGAQKAGTTWLWENLRRHPEIFVPEKKELHYFDNKFDRSLRYYTQRFEEARGRVKGEITPAYGILPRERIRFIRAIMPRVRLIFLMRDPVERAWSQAVMELVVRGGRALHEVPESEFLAFLESERSVSRGHYCRMLDNWLSWFPSEQLWVGFFEDIRERPRELMSELFAHLGVSREVDWSAFPLRQVILPSVEPRGAGAQGRCAGAAPADAGGESTPCPASIRTRLRQLYAEELARLSERYGERVAHWR
jgi:hypothetical protein